MNVVSLLVGAIVSAATGAVLALHLHMKYSDAVLAKHEAEWQAKFAAQAAAQDKATVESIDTVLLRSLERQQELIDRLQKIDQQAYAREKAWRKERETNQDCDVWMRQPIACSLHSGTPSDIGAKTRVGTTTGRMSIPDSVGPGLHAGNE